MSAAPASSSDEPDASAQRRYSVRAMRVLLAAWEFPPLAVGGDAAHVDGLARPSGRAGHDVVVLTVASPGRADRRARSATCACCGPTSTCRGSPTTSSSAGAASANHHLVQLTTHVRRVAARRRPRPQLAASPGRPTRWPCSTARRSSPRSTPRRRSQHGGRMPPGEPAAIHAVESWLAHGSSQVMARRGSWRARCIVGFERRPREGAPHPQRHRPDVVGGRRAARDSRAPLVLTWGRVQYEKGFQVLARAMSLAAVAGAGHRVHHRRARQLPARAAVADRHRGRQRHRPAGRVRARREAARPRSTGPAAW